MFSSPFDGPEAFRRKLSSKNSKQRLARAGHPGVGGSSRLADISPNRSKLSKNFCPKRGSSSSEADALENMEWRPPPSERVVSGKGLVAQLGAAGINQKRLVCIFGTGYT